MGGRRAGGGGGVFVQAPKSDIFVALLGISLGAIVIGCILMLIILMNYGFSINAV